MNFTDPRNSTDLLSAAGDFTAIDQYENVEQLKTYGILRIKVQDHEHKPLNLAGNMKVYLDADQVISNSN